MTKLARRRSSTAVKHRRTIESLRGTGPFTTEPIATLSFTLQSVATTREVAENTAAAAAIGDPVAATDPDGASVTHTLGGTDAASFGIVAATGQLQTSAPLDYETRSSHTVEVTATNPSGVSASVTVIIEVDDVNEALGLADLGRVDPFAELAQRRGRRLAAGAPPAAFSEVDRLRWRRRRQ